MQVVMNKYFLLNPETKFGTDLACCFWKKCKNCLTLMHFNYEKLLSPSQRTIWICKLSPFESIGFRKPETDLKLVTGIGW